MANAVSNAIGIRVTELPMTGERIHQLLRRRRET
jgi:CO/xanthine dehydrogenase Mo-binding subunit